MATTDRSVEAHDQRDRTRESRAFHARGIEANDDELERVLAELDRDAARAGELLEQLYAELDRELPAVLAELDRETEAFDELSSES